MTTPTIQTKDLLFLNLALSSFLLTEENKKLMPVTYKDMEAVHEKIKVMIKEC